MAGLTFAIHDLALMFGFAVMTAEAVVEGFGPEIRSFRMVRVPRFRVGGHVPPRYDDGIALDRLFVHHP